MKIDFKHSNIRSSKFLFLILHLILLPLFVKGQNNIKIDEMISKGQLMLKTNVDSALILFNQGIEKARNSSEIKLLAKCYYLKAKSLIVKTDYTEAKKCLEISDSLYKSIKFKEGSGDVFGLYGNIFKRQNNYKQALDYYKKSLEIAQSIGDTIGVPGSLLNIGMCYDYMGEYSMAVKNYKMAEKLFEKNNDSSSLAVVYVNLGTVYYYNKDILLAIEYTMKANNIYENAGENIRLCLGLCNVAEIYLEIDSLDLAYKYILKAQAYNKNTGDLRTEAMIYGNLGYYYLASKKMDLALINFEKQVKIFNRIGAIEDIAISKNSMAEINTKIGNYHKAIEIYQEIIPTIGDSNFLFNCKKRIAINFFKIQDYKNAYLSLEESNQLKDKILDTEKQKAIIELETKYETEKKECIISQQNLEIKNKNMGLGLVGGGLFGAIGLATLLYRKRRQEQELNQLLDQQNRVLQDANQGLLHQLSIQRESDEVAQEPLMITLSNGSQSTVNIDDIQYFEAENNIVKIVLADGTVRHDYQRLKNFTELLKDSAMFIQIHRSYLVNVNHVTSHRANDLKMRSGDTLPIGITMKEKVHAKLKEKGV
jgi:tetratricopeptide (TPR) repeat protein